MGSARKLTGVMAGTLQLPYGAQNVGPSGQAEQMISRDFPRHAVEDVLFDSPGLRVGDPAYRAAISDVLSRIQATGRVTQIQSPLDPRFANQVSATRHAALLQFRTAVLLNLLSVAAAYGVIVALFQWGWGQTLLGFTSVHSVASWLPLFLFVVLFGLSMDYHVFILSRIRESYDRTGRTDLAETAGIKTTAGVVTAAAVVMVFVFLTFATLSMIQLKEMGVGLAVAVLLDATVVRALLLPATMKLLGPRNWYLPRWLGWLPQPSRPALLPTEPLTGPPAPPSAAPPVTRVGA
jgi:putative drug exporter of the RND superfamily